MKKLSREKKQQLILTALVTLTLMAGLWYGLIRVQQRSLAALSIRKAEVQKELAEVRATIARADQIQADLEEHSATLAKWEDNMASGDIYAWIITKVRTFKNSYPIEIPQFSQIDGPKDVSLLPEFPYKQASLTVAGTAKFHDLGVFIADFENKHPFTRICNLAVEPANMTLAPDKEKLAFRFDIVCLIKPAGSITTGTL